MVFSILTFDMGDTKIEMTPSVSPRQPVRKMNFLTLKGQFQNLTSGQVKVRPRLDHDPSRSICTCFEVARRAESLGTVCVSLSPSCRDFLEKTDCDLI